MHWKHLPLSIGLPAIIFILWDMAFTKMGVWGFNQQYITGIEIYNLPLEEVLFFICIPYACLFTYFAFGILVRKNIFSTIAPTTTYILILALLITGFMFFNRWYTAVTFLSLAIFLIFLKFILKPDYLGRFYFTFLVVLIPFFIINGILTGSFILEEVVWYNNQENVGVRMGSIPVEDTFYGMFLLLMNVVLYEWSLHKEKISTKGHYQV